MLLHIDEASGVRVGFNFTALFCRHKVFDILQAVSMSPLSPSCLRHWSIADARYVLILEARFLSGLMDELKT
jgi:hypothetical protein